MRLASLAEKVGFEPTVRFGRTHDFQSCTFDHSVTSPKGRKHTRSPAPRQANPGLGPKGMRYW